VAYVGELVSLAYVPLPTVMERSECLHSVDAAGWERSCTDPCRPSCRVVCRLHFCLNMGRFVVGLLLEIILLALRIQTG